MIERGAYNSQLAYARLAGFMYLFVDAVSQVGDSIRSKLQVDGNFVETAYRIMASETLYRIGVSFEFITALCLVWLAVSLYVTVKPVDNNLAIVALLCWMAEAVFGAITGLIDFAFFHLHVAAKHANAIDTNQLRMLSELNSHASGVAFDFSVIVFSMGSIIFFYLFLRSSYIPRVLSVLGLFGSMLVPLVAFTNLILPLYAGITAYGYLPIFVAEILVGLWLLIKGIRIQSLVESGRA